VYCDKESVTFEISEIVCVFVTLNTTDVESSLANNLRWLFYSEGSM